MVEQLPVVKYGTVSGRFIAAAADSRADSDANPDGYPITGKVSFTPSVSALIIDSAQPPVTVLPVKITADLDAAGYISLNGARGLTLVATDDDNTNPRDFTYLVEFSELKFTNSDGFSTSVSYRAFSITIPAGTNTDLALTAPVPSSSGNPVVHNETVIVEARQQVLDSRDDVVAREANVVILQGKADAARVAAEAARDAITDSSALPARIKPSAKPVSSTDLNTLVENGWYSGDKLTNSPDGSAGAFYIDVAHVATGSGDYTWQRAAAAGLGTGNAGYAWQRFQEGNGGWSTWRLMGDPKGAVDTTLRTALSPTERIAAKSKNIEGQDLNGILDNGWYVGPGLQNAPDGSYYYVQVETFEAANWVQQRAINVVNGATAVRQKRSGTWSEWVQTADSAGAVDANARILGNGAVPLSSAVAGQVFAKNASGAPTGIAYSANALANYLALRDAAGQLPVPTPTATTHAAPKQYVDDRAGDKAPAVSAAGVTGTYDLAQASAGSCTYRLQLTGNVTLTIPTPSTALLTWTVSLVIRQDATGGRLITWPAAIKWAGGVKPTLSTAANAIDVVTVVWTGVEWLGFASGKAFA